MQGGPNCQPAVSHWAGRLLGGLNSGLAAWNCATLVGGLKLGAQHCGKYSSGLTTAPVDETRPRESIPFAVNLLSTLLADESRRVLAAWGFMWLSMCFFTSGSVAKRRLQFGIGQQNGLSPERGFFGTFSVTFQIIINSPNLIFYNFRNVKSLSFKSFIRKHNQSRNQNRTRSNCTKF